MRRSSSETRKKILTACVRLFLEQGYKNTSVSQIVDEAGVARGSYLNLFPTKDRILLDLTETMFGGQFGVARSIADSKLPPVYAYAVDTAIQLTLTELNENLREIYIEAYYRSGHGGIYLCAYHGGAERDFRREFPRLQRQRFL